MKKDRAFSLRRVFFIPAALFLISLAGLVWALLVDGFSDAFAGLAVAVSLLVPAWYILRHKR